MSFAFISMRICPKQFRMDCDKGVSMSSQCTSSDVEDCRTPHTSPMRRNWVGYW